MSTSHLPAVAFSGTTGNDGRFMIVKIITDEPKVPAGSACLIFMTPAGTNPAVADDPNNGHIDWRVEECAFDVRARGTAFEHLTFMVRPGRTITRMVDVTESPEPDSMGLTHVKFADCCFTSRLITGANARWGVTLAELVLPKPGKAAIYQEENGVPRPYQPPNCDFVSFADCYFDGLQEAGVAHCNSPDGGGVIPAVSPGQNPVTRGRRHVSMATFGAGPRSCAAC